MTPGDADALTVFELKPGWRFVTPICFEDIDAELVRRMFKPVDGKKRADLIVNLTNDGWFKVGTRCRSICRRRRFAASKIAHRPTGAGGANTGISGFNESNGRQQDLLGAVVEGTSVATLSLDSRVTIYSRVGDVFAMACAAIAAGLAIISLGRWWLGRKKVAAAH